MLRLIIATIIALALASSSNPQNNTYNVDPPDTTGFTGGENGNIPPPRP